MIEGLYLTYYSELVKWCSKMTKNLSLAEELVQEAFLRAMLHEETLATLGEKQRRAWLYRVIKNLYVDRTRRNSYEIVVEVIPESVDESEDVANLEWEQLLESLPDMEGVLFAMRYLQGYNSEQLSQIFHMPSGTIRSKLSSARKHLKEAIGGKLNVR
ncbi:MAG: RNA polymerase sigma factor [Lachnospiraceae bacterium]|nr:RNA polymerase sigma factor [Lachnospiraceae bacterium]